MNLLPDGKLYLLYPNTNLRKLWSSVQTKVTFEQLGLLLSSAGYIAGPSVTKKVSKLTHRFARFNRDRLTSKEGEDG